MELVFFVILVCVIVFSLLTKVISRTVLTLPIIFMVLGYSASIPIEMLAPPAILDETTLLLAETTLVLVLFSDASHVRFSSLRKSIFIPIRMLVIGMPLSIAMGTLVVYWIVPEIGFAMALLIAAILTPTDAALGQPVVSNPEVPLHLSQSINVESGVNDGLALPFIVLGALLAADGVNIDEIDGLGRYFALQVLLGPVAGGAVGWGVSLALDYARDQDWVVESAQGVVFLVTAFAAYLAALLIGGNGFIAAFVAGAVFGNTSKHDIHFITEFMESQGQLFTMSAFFIFGALLLPHGLELVTLKVAFVAIMFLTVVRILPIWLSLAGTGLPLKDKLFLGWFGPRGLASILFTLIMIDRFDIPYENELQAFVSVTVFLSILLHGLSSLPLSQRIGR